MSALVMTPMQRTLQLLRSEGMVVEYGNPGYPGEVWLAHSNADNRWNRWHLWTCLLPGPRDYHISVHWWYGRWVRPP